MAGFARISVVPDCRQGDRRDVAYVLGSLPDGWWDRADAAARLHAQVARLAASGRVILPEGIGPPGEASPPGFVMGGRPSTSCWPRRCRCTVPAARYGRAAGPCCGAREQGPGSPARYSILAHME